MTKREKIERAKAKKRLQAQGVLPPDKPKLNRKKYIAEAREAWNGRAQDCYVWEIFLYKAIGIMLEDRDRDFRVSQEAVGVAKCLKLALRLKEFYDRLESEGRETYTVKEQYEFIKDILKA